MTEQAVRIHPWERAGLGIAPFRFIGAFHSVYQAVPGDPNCPVQPGSSCDYCGQGISQVCRISDARGHEFKVGCDCVRRVNAEGSRIITDAERAVRQNAKIVKLAKLKVRVEAAITALEAYPALLTDQPSPTQRGTMRDYTEWCIKNAGAQGKTTACMRIEAALAKVAA